ncbi:MAG: redoxin domain-containing protein [Planctomycetes bacterium]|nr:redoxin domain-containing protein [Planctomycetota bacterium]
MLLTLLRRLIKGTPKMLEVGSPCPEFSVVDSDGNTVTRADLVGKRTVLWFYPRASTPG